VIEILTLVYRYARAIWRRRGWAVAAAWVIALAGWAVVMVLPDRYQASARVYVDARSALRPALEGIAIEPDYEAQLLQVREALLSRPQLEAVARRTNLDAGITTPAQLDDLITTLQEQIVIQTQQGSSSRGPASNALYTISYRHPQRDKSVEVVRTLLENFEQGALNGNRSGTDQAGDFLDTQIATLEARLSATETKLADYKKKNIGLIPGDKGDYYTRLSSEMAGLQESETSLAVATSRRAELQRQLGSARRSVLNSVTSGTGGTAGAALDVTLRRQDAENKLNDLLLRYTDKHPEVVALRQTIDDLKRQEASEVAQMQANSGSVDSVRPLSMNPVYQQIQGQLNQVQVEIAAFQGQAQQHRQEIANLRRFVDQAPEVEQEYARLSRDYSTDKEQYQRLVARREQARISDDAARTGIVEFAVIEPPRAAPRPVAPKRPLLIAAVLVMAVGAGLALALLPQLLRPTVDDVAALESLGRPVLGAVSAVRTAADALNWKQQVRKVALNGAGLVALAGLLVVFGGAAGRMLRGLLA
jgi:polysaccharide chain length determinant protein (PEP-CTERM system associated)